MAATFLIYSWLAQHPTGFQSVDEQGYSRLALTDLRGVQGGPMAVLHATYGINAPLVPLLSAVFLWRNPGRTATVLVQLPFVILLIFAVYLLCRQLAGHRAGILGAAAALCTPGVLTWSRQLHFAVAATALMTAAVAAVSLSAGMRRPGLSITAGAMLGLAILSRTMVLGLVPGVVVGAVVLGIHSRTAWLTLTRNVALLVVAAVVVAGPWYWPNRSSVFGYLTNNATSGDFADNLKPTELAYWTARFIELAGYFQAPLLLLGLVIVVLAATRLRRAPAMPPLVVFVAVVVVCELAVLTITRNSGTAFALPVAPLVIALVVRAGSTVSGRTRQHLALATLVVCGWNVIAGAIPLPGIQLGWLWIVDGRAPNDVQFASTLGDPNATIADPTRLGRQLRAANCAIARRGPDPIMITNSSALINPASIENCPAIDESDPVAAYYPACPANAQYGVAATNCIRSSVQHFGWRTIVTGDVGAAYPGSIGTNWILPVLQTSYVEVGRYPIGSNSITIWALRAVAK